MNNCNTAGNPVTDPIEVSQRYIRYEALSNKVFMVSNTGTLQTETKIYDFNLTASDTIPLIPPTFIDQTRIIDAVKNISFFGIPDRKYFLRGYPSDNYIIEGMGGSNGLTYYNPNQILVSGYIFITNLKCFKSGNNAYNPSGISCP